MKTTKIIANCLVAYAGLLIIVLGYVAVYSGVMWLIVLTPALAAAWAMLAATNPYNDDK